MVEKLFTEILEKVLELQGELIKHPVESEFDRICYNTTCDDIINGINNCREELK